MSRKLVVEIIGDASSLDRSLKQATVASNRFGKEVSHSLRGVASGTGIMHNFGRSLAFASGGFLAFEGASRFLEESVSAARDAGVAQRSLAAQMKTSGESFGAVRGEIEQANLRLAKFGFTSEDAVHALTVLERGTGNIGQALKLETVSADLARAKNIDLASAANVVAKVFGGQETALRRAVPGLSKQAHGVDLITAAQRRLAGQAQAGTTVSERFAATLHDTEVIVGTALLPTLNKYLGSLSRWLDRMNRTGQLQRDVAGAVNLATGAIGAAKAAVTPLVGAFRALNSVTGSTKDTLKLLFSAFVAFKGLKLAATFTQLSGSLRGVGTAAEGSTGKVTGLRGALGSLPTVVATTVAIDIIMNAHTTAHGVHRYSGSAGWANLWHDLGHPLRLIQNLAGGGGGDAAGGGGNLFSPNFKLPNITANIPLPVTPTFVPHDLPTGQAAASILGAGALTATQRNALALAAAARTKTTKDDYAALVTQRVLLAKAIRTETARLKGATTTSAAKSFADNLQSLYDKDAANNDRLAAIVKKGAQQGKTGAELAGQRNTWFDNMIGRLIDRAQDNIPKLKHVAALIEQRIAATKDVTRKLSLEDTLATVQRTISGDITQQRADRRQGRLDAAQLLVDRVGLTKTLSDDLAALKHQLAVLKAEGATRSEIVAQQAAIHSKEDEIKQAGKDRLANLRQQKLDAATLAVARADLTGNLTKELAARKHQLVVLKQTGATQLEIVDQQQSINDVQDQIDEKNKQAAARIGKRAVDFIAATNKAAAAEQKGYTDWINKTGRARRAAAITRRNAEQFRELGLTATGEQKTPGVDALTRRLGNLKKQLPPSLFESIGKVLAEGVNKVGQPVRAAIDGILDKYDQLGEKTKSSLTVFRHASAANIAASLGADLTRAQRLRLETGLRGVGPGGSVPSGRSLAFSAGHTTVINGGVHLHDVQNVPRFENELAKRANARGHTRRGTR